MCVNTFTADDKYSLLNRDNLTKPIRMELSQKRKHLMIFFIYLFFFEIYMKFRTF